MKPDTRKQIDPIASGRQTTLLTSAVSKLSCIARKVSTLK